MAKNKLGAIVVGLVAVQPLLLTIVTQFGKPTGEDRPGDLFAWVFTTLAFGPVIGLVWIRGWRGSDSAP